MFFKKKRYLNWSEYKDRISKIENLMFMTLTTKQAVNNHWQREGKKW